MYWSKYGCRNLVVSSVEFELEENGVAKAKVIKKKDSVILSGYGSRLNQNLELLSIAVAESGSVFIKELLLRSSEIFEIYSRNLPGYIHLTLTSQVIFAITIASYPFIFPGKSVSFLSLEKQQE